MRVHGVDRLGADGPALVGERGLDGAQVARGGPQDGGADQVAGAAADERTVAVVERAADHAGVGGAAALEALGGATRAQGRAERGLESSETGEHGYLLAVDGGGPGSGGSSRSGSAAAAHLDPGKR